jgi:hypothetical protein
MQYLVAARNLNHKKLGIGKANLATMPMLKFIGCMPSDYFYLEMGLFLRGFISLFRYSQDAPLIVDLSAQLILFIN